MAEMKKCDRCGKIYEKNNLHNTKAYCPLPAKIVGISFVDEYLSLEQTVFLSYAMNAFRNFLIFLWGVINVCERFI